MSTTEAHTGSEPAQPPTPERRPHVHVTHGHERPDELSWLSSKEDPAVLAHLEAENAYVDAHLAPLEPLIERIYEEGLSRIQETDEAVPVEDGGWLYWSRTVEGLQYPIFCRRRGTLAGEQGDEEVLLDQNHLAGDSEYFAIGAMDVSPDHRLLAYAVDTKGDEVYELRVKDLETGEHERDVIQAISASGAFSADGTWLFYLRHDETQRPYQLWRHRMGSDPSDDELVLEESDERFGMTMGRTKDDRFILVEVDSSTTSEAWFVPADRPDAPARAIEPRQHGVEYSVDHLGDRFYIRTNADGAEDFKLVAAPDDDPSRERWEEVVPHEPGVPLRRFDVFDGHLVLSIRRGGYATVRVVPLDGGEAWDVDPPAEVATIHTHPLPDVHSRVFRIVEATLARPACTFDVDLRTRERTLRKRQPTPGYDPEPYVEERLEAEGEGGARIPISVVRRADTPADGTAPCLLYVYGAYDHTIDPFYSPYRVSLLDRGFVFAIAHVRGGGEVGRRWYLDGKLENKHRTITDTIACAEALIAAGRTGAGRIIVRGGSAGGIPVGGFLNERPELLAAAIAEVPFVDCVTTMLDESLPLTSGEWEEWGDPRDEAQYRWYLRWSPYDNVRRHAYPPVLATAGLNDPRVGYWEPAKWVCRLREHTTGTAPILLKTELGAGHGGPSGRYKGFRDEAEVLAWACAQVGITE